MRAMTTSGLCRLAPAALALLLACGDAAPDHRPLDRYSPMVKAIRDQPVPGDIETTRVLAAVLHLAHDPGAPYLARYAMYEGLLHLVGEAPATRPPKVEHAILEMQSADQVLQRLRERVLENPVQAKVLTETDATLEPRLYSWTFRHDGRSVWTRGDGKDIRVMGVRVTNPGARALAGGRFTLELAPQPDPLSFSCSYGPLPAGESVNVGCYGDPKVPVQDLSAVLDHTPGRVRLEHREVVLQVGEGRFEVRPHEAAFRDDGSVDRRAEEMVAQRSCGARGSCAAEAGDALEAEPGILGLLLGLAAGIVWWLVELSGGKRAARASVAIMGAVLAIVVAATLAAMVSSISKGPAVLVVFLSVMAGGKALELVAGFAIGLLGTVALVQALRQARAGA